MLFVAAGWCSRSDGGRAAGRGRRAVSLATARERSAGRAVRTTPRDARRRGRRALAPARRSPSSAPPDHGSHRTRSVAKSRDEDAPVLRAWTFLAAGSAGERGGGATRKEVSLRISRSLRSDASLSPARLARRARGERQSRSSTRHVTRRARSRNGSNARAGTHSRRPRPSWRETCKPF